MISTCSPAPSLKPRKGIKAKAPRRKEPPEEPKRDVWAARSFFRVFALLRLRVKTSPRNSSSTATAAWATRKQPTTGARVRARNRDFIIFSLRFRMPGRPAREFESRTNDGRIYCIRFHGVVTDFNSSATNGEHLISETPAWSTNTQAISRGSMTSMFTPLHKSARSKSNPPNSPAMTDSRGGHSS